MSSSSSTSSSSSRSALPRKRKQAIPESSDNSVAEDISDASSASEEDSDSDAPQPPPLIEEPVLSHAERRRQKKRQKQSELGDSAESQSPRKKRKLDDGTGVSSSDAHAGAKAETKTKHTNPTKVAAAAADPRRQKRQNSVWIGNLSYKTTEETLRGFFDGVGTITRVHMPIRRPQNENMGFAYVDFETPEAKVIATTLSEVQLDGRNLLIKDGDSFAGRPAKAKPEGTEGDGKGQGKNTTMTNGKVLSKMAQKILRVQKQPPAMTLFLGNLGFATTEASIRELFEAHRYWRSMEKGKGKGAGVNAEKQKAREDGDGDGDAAKSKDPWIRKIRMGTFEDSGNCKGWAFIDFTSTEHATEALVNPRNHRLNGRDLVVEYASPDAVRRGGGPRNQKGDGDKKSKSEFGVGRTSQKGSANAPFAKQRRPQHVEQEDHADDEETLVKTTPTFRFEPRRSDRAGHVHDRSHTRRSKPGAALAQAQRQSAAILPGGGQKIVF